MINRTTGKPQPGAMVMLFKLGQTSGPEMLASTKRTRRASSRFAQDVAGGPHLVRGGLRRRHLQPRCCRRARRPTGVQLEVYDSSKKPGAARKFTQHMVLLEPAGAQLAVSETFFFNNDGQASPTTTRRTGTLRFFVPAEGKESVRVMATAPQGMPVQRAPQEANEAGVYKLELPHQARRDAHRRQLHDAVHGCRAIFGPHAGDKACQRGLVAPDGVTLTGEGLEAARQ